MTKASGKDKKDLKISSVAAIDIASRVRKLMNMNAHILLYSPDEATMGEKKRMDILVEEYNNEILALYSRYGIKIWNTE